MEHLGNNIARLRNFRRIPQKEMAAKLRMTQQAYSAVENKAEIDEDLLEKIAEVLDFPVQAVRELDAHSVLSINQQGGNAGSVFYQYNPNEKIQELYERLLKEKDDIIKSKDEVIEMYRKQKNVS
ncbi:helix-turn-helix domain-containing protein [Mucilaginibacter ginsenosidivorans]|uniref:Helix-turn-helix transcriptional regulator n=1 Tax=Mucilaginibacter ginsenosidivorans TaxID=398053 RepID=A0A5B8USA1_9SPHI|nr:helix-turn-helix transcriptional regulator [Mucilaginibacter ginsenosidivorans]QEC61950.1 helix-turn-helix transcriptional regulator [Mucilaginibacter ginsenosidivorans]